MGGVKWNYEFMEKKKYVNYLLVTIIQELAHFFPWIKVVMELLCFLRIYWLCFNECFTTALLKNVIVYRILEMIPFARGSQTFQSSFDEWVGKSLKITAPGKLGSKGVTDTPPQSAILVHCSSSWAHSHEESLFILEPSSAI